MAKATQAEDAQVRPFADFLREQAKGKTHEELSELMQKLVNAVVETGKPGTLTLQIKVAPIKKAEAHVLQVTDQVVLKAPAHDRPVSVFFSTNIGNLQRKDPTSPELGLGLKGIDGGRDTDEATKEARA